MDGVKLPDEWRARIEDLATGRVAPSEARHAATVVVLRDHDEHGLQAFMLRRTSSMAFAAGAYVFPGGSVDPRDAEHGIGWAGPSPAEWGEAFGVAPTLARELVCAAVRETYEESLVLLAGSTADTVLGDTRGLDWEADRQALLDHTMSFAEFLDKRGLVLRSDLLRPFGHWITPVIEKKRYDTRFFVAAIPHGQLAGDVSTEADQVVWLRPADAIDKAERGEIALLAPTLATLRDLVPFRTVDEVLAARRRIITYEPRPAIIDGDPYLMLP